jgi:hypothetical protein
MSDFIEKINSSFNDPRRDTSFDPNLLDELEESERKEVEDKIVRLCLYGDRVSYQYIPYLDIYDPKEVFTDESLKELKPFDRALIYKSAYLGSLDEYYLDKIVSLAKDDINSYSMFTLMCKNNLLNDDYKDIAKEIADSKEDETYKKMYENRIAIERKVK